MPALLLPNEILSMSAQAVRRLVETGEGDCALLYLALLEGGDVRKAQQALHWDESRLNCAYGRLARLGLVAAQSAPVQEPKPQVEEETRYSRKDIADALEREPEFCALYREVERLLNKPLTDADLHGLYTIYDGLAMSPEVICMLVTHKIRTVRRQKQNPGALPRMSQIKSEAAYWKRLGLDSVEAAEEYLSRQQQVDRREWDILSAVGVKQPRPAVEREREYINAWVELGIRDELITMAYERTVYRKGQMNWPYMNKILLSWHQAGWRKAEQVKAGEKTAKTPTRQGVGQPDYQPSAERISRNGDWLDAFLEQQQKGE